MSLWLEDVKLSGQHVHLVPMSANHRDGLLKAASDGCLWELWYTGVPSAENIDEYLAFAQAEKEAGRSLAFAITDRHSGEVIGSSRYCNATPQHKRLEIGYTWYAASRQRTAVNTECKLLMLSHAFETLGCIAVEFRTHWHNHASRNAIARLGAKQDGVLRNHWLGPDGLLRDTVVFSIIASEWATVRHSLQFKLESGEQRR